jgi:molecular chaperone GrpE
MSEKTDKKQTEKDHIEELLDEAEAPGENAEAERDETPSPEAENTALKEKILRQAADHDNHIKRLIRENDERIKYANQTLLTKFLPVLDSFDRAFEHIEIASVESLTEGIALTRKQLMDTLEKAGLQTIPVATGDPFDPALHEGIMLANNPELPDNSVALLVQNGYRLGERIVRSAKVQVNKLG